MGRLTLGGFADDVNGCGGQSETTKRNVNKKGLPIGDADDEQDGAKAVDVEREEEEERVVR